MVSAVSFPRIGAFQEFVGGVYRFSTSGVEDSQPCFCFIIIVSRLEFTERSLCSYTPTLVRAIMTMFQVPDAVYDPITRTAALISMICALMSLTYGCIYIVRFGTMRSMYRASRWAEVRLYFMKVR